MQKIAQLFEKVVVDWSVIKFCHGPHATTFETLLTPHQDSELIIEAIEQIMMAEGERPVYDAGNQSVSLPEKDFYNADSMEKASSLLRLAC